MQTFSCRMQDLFSRPGVKPEPRALGVWSFSHWTTREVPRDGLLKRVVKKTTSQRRKSEHKDSHEGISPDDTWGKNVPGEGTASGGDLTQRVTSKGDEAMGVGPDGGRCGHRDGAAQEVRRPAICYTT